MDEERSGYDPLVKINPHLEISLIFLVQYGSLLQLDIGFR